LGVIAVNPVHKIANDELATVKQLITKFGMTPSNRQNVKAIEPLKKKHPDQPLALVADFSNIGKPNRRNKS